MWRVIHWQPTPERGRQRWIVRSPVFRRPRFVDACLYQLKTISLGSNSCGARGWTRKQTASSVLTRSLAGKFVAATVARNSLTHHLSRIGIERRRFRTMALWVAGPIDADIGGGRQADLVSRSSPAFVRSRSVDLRKRHVDKPEIHRELATMVDEMVQVLADHFSTWRRK
jgi:hypothetical protein